MSMALGHDRIVICVFVSVAEIAKDIEIANPLRYEIGQCVFGRGLARIGRGGHNIQTSNSNEEKDPCPSCCYSTHSCTPS